MAYIPALYTWRGTEIVRGTEQWETRPRVWFCSVLEGQVGWLDLKHQFQMQIQDNFCASCEWKSRLPLEGTWKSWALSACLHCTLTKPPVSWSKQMMGSQWIWHGRGQFYRATWTQLIRFWMAPQWWPPFLAPEKDILTSHNPFGCLALSLGKTIF